VRVSWSFIDGRYCFAGMRGHNEDETVTFAGCRRILLATCVSLSQMGPDSNQRFLPELLVSRVMIHEIHHEEHVSICSHHA
jgi:hypothetical protein